MQELRRRMAALVEPAGPYPAAAVEDVLALALLLVPAGSRGASSLVETEVMGALAARAGIPPHASPAEMRTHLAAYVAAHPPPPALAGALADLVLDVTRDSSADRLRAAAQSLRDQRTTHVLDGGVRPKGTIPAGPLAAFIALDKKP